MSITGKNTDNPIIAELWAAKDAIAKKYDYNLRALFDDSRNLVEQLKKEGYVFRSPQDKVKAEPSKR